MIKFKFDKNCATKPKFMCIGAHKDDVEIMAFDGIIKGLDGGFVAVVLTSGSTCPKGEMLKDLSPKEISALRTNEQLEASKIGKYAGLYLIEKESPELQNYDEQLVHSLCEILQANRGMDTVYIHSPFDRHKTHRRAFDVAIDAFRMLDKADLPRKVYACEVWGSLDWYNGKYRTEFVLDGHEQLAYDLMSCFKSQNQAKRYDLAVGARRQANATFGDGHALDMAKSVALALDVTDLVCGKVEKEEFIDSCLAEFKGSII